MRLFQKRIIRIVSFCFVFIFLLTSVSFSTDYDSVFVWSTIQSGSQRTTEATLVNSETIEENSNTENSLNLESGAAILIEQNTGQILYSHNIHEKLRAASVTKVMSILLIMEALDNGQISLTDQIPCSENASSMGGSQIWLDPTETLSVDEMLKAICVVSANDYNVQK